MTPIFHTHIASRMTHHDASHHPVDFKGLAIDTDLFRQVLAIDVENAARAIERVEGIAIAEKTVQGWRSSVHTRVLAAIQRESDPRMLLPDALRTCIQAALEDVIGAKYVCICRPFSVYSPCFPHEW